MDPNRRFLRSRTQPERPEKLPISVKNAAPNNGVLHQMDRILEHYDKLQREFGLPREGAIFDCLKAARQPDGSIPLEAELFIQAKLGKPLAEQRRLRSQYDMLSGGLPGSASAESSDKLLHRFLGHDNEGQAIRLGGPLLENVGPQSHQIEDYLAHGGYQAAAKALNEMTPADIIAEVKQSNLKGRGGAYFPVGVKWEAVANAEADRKFLICNADEGEPPTRKDKVLIDHNPHLLLEGVLIAGKAIGVHLGIIYVRGDYAESIERLSNAIAEAEAKGWLGKNIQGSGFDFSVHIFTGSGSYVAGCDTAMLESIEGKAAIPRATAPFPTEHGLAGKPTVVNNVETLCNIPIIVKDGGLAFSQIGTPSCPGTKIFGLCGDIAKPGMYELPTGTPLLQIIEQAGGVIEQQNGKTRPGTLKAVSPGGVTTGLLTVAEAVTVTMDPKSLFEKGAYLGSGAIAIFNDKRDIRAFAEEVMEFFAEESCGNCMECPICIGITQKTLARTHRGKATVEEIQSISDRDQMLPLILKCGLGKTSHTTAKSALTKFPDDFLVEQLSLAEELGQR